MNTLSIGKYRRKLEALFISMMGQVMISSGGTKNVRVCENVILIHIEVLMWGHPWRKKNKRQPSASSAVPEFAWFFPKYREQFWFFKGKASSSTTKFPSMVRSLSPSQPLSRCCKNLEHELLSTILELSGQILRISWSFYTSLHIDALELALIEQLRPRQKLHTVGPASGILCMVCSHHRR